MAKTQHRQSSGEYFLLGYEAIAGALGVHRQTIWRWVRDYGFPLASLPDGHVITSNGLIDLWLMERLKPSASTLQPRESYAHNPESEGQTPNGAAHSTSAQLSPLAEGQRRPATESGAERARRIAAVTAMLEANPSLLGRISGGDLEHPQTDRSAA